MLPVIGIHLGHDMSATVYVPEKDEFIIIEAERILDDKHCRAFAHTCYAFYVKMLQYLERQHQIKNDFEFVVVRSVPVGKKYYYTFHSGLEIIRAKHIIHHEDFVPDHHNCHAYSAYCQAGYKNAFCLTYDGGGDGTDYRIYKIKDGKIVFKEDMVYELNHMYNYCVKSFPRLLKTTPDNLDIAGKLMGMAGFGKKELDFIEPEFIRISRLEDNEENREYHEIKKAANRPGKIRRFKSYFLEKFRKRIFDHDSMTVEDENNAAKTIQRLTEDFVVSEFKKYKNHIEECDNNVIISGGIALNVIINERLKREFPQYNFYVNTNPHDGGLSLGRIYGYLLENGFEMRNDYKLMYAGTYLLDIEALPGLVHERAARETSLDEVSEMLSEGDIIGFIHGRCEIGPRALGNRSILCDASYPNMKDIINLKVKKREVYRPFAPACKYEDAHKYFYTPSFENMEGMQFVADVKDEYKETLESITHVDGTARLQTVKKESNPVFYELLDKFDGVLLNTSFNRSGKPILNRVKDALDMLDSTKLDAVVVGDLNNKFWLFTK